MRYLTILVTAILLSVGIGVASATDTRPNWQRIECTPKRTTNCFYDATTHKQGGHSFYSVKVGTRKAILYWDADFARKNNHMESLR